MHPLCTGIRLFTLRRPVPGWWLDRHGGRKWKVQAPLEQRVVQGFQVSVPPEIHTVRSSADSSNARLLIDSMLILDPAQRPDIDKVIELTDGVIKTIR